MGIVLKKLQSESLFQNIAQQSGKEFPTICKRKIDEVSASATNSDKRDHESAESPLHLEEPRGRPRKKPMVE